MIPIQKDRKPTPSEKRKELRKEKSRAAARCRRGRESEVFDDMLAVLPMPAGCREQLDKASVVRLAINYVKLREFMRDTYAGDCTSAGEGVTRTFDVNSFGHFLLLLNDAGEIVYVTENIAKVLGLSQFDLFGNSVYDFIHPCDHDDVRAALHDRDSAICTLFARMKCTLLPKGRAVHIKSATYKVVKFTGQAYRHHSIKKDGAAKASVQHHLLLTGELIPNPSDGEVVMDESMFMTHHNLDMKISYYDGRLVEKLGYEESALVGTSLYDYVHASDAKPMEKLFKTLYSKGQVSTERYRLLVGGGGYVWVVTQATVVLSKKTNAPKQVVCIHTVLSNVNETDVIYAQVQQTVGTGKQAVAPAIAMSNEVGTIDVSSPTAFDCTDTGIVDATEALFSDMNCDSGCESADEPKSDIFAATVSLFKDFSDDDWLTVGGALAGTAELFDDDDQDSLRPMTPVDLSEGLLVDTSGLDACLDASLDEELDMCMRAPYIPMCPSSDEVFTSTRTLDGTAAASFAATPITPLLSTTGPYAAPQDGVAQPRALRLQLLPLRSGLYEAGMLQHQHCGPVTSSNSFETGVSASVSPRPGCSAPCSPSLPTSQAEVGNSGSEAIQTLWAQLSHMLSSYGDVPTDAVVKAVIQSVGDRADAERNLPRTKEGDAPRSGRLATPGTTLARAERADLLLTGDGSWLDDIVPACMLTASGRQEKVHLPQKRPASQRLILATSPPKKSLMSTTEGSGPWSQAGECRTAAGVRIEVPAKYTKIDAACDVEEGKRSLLLRLLLHGHDGRNGVSENDGCGDGWLGSAMKHSCYTDGQQLA